MAQQKTVNVHEIDDVVGAPHNRDHFEAITCPACDEQRVRFREMEGSGEAECPKCGSTIQLAAIVR